MLVYFNNVSNSASICTKNIVYILVFYGTNTPKASFCFQYFNIEYWKSTYWKKCSSISFWINRDQWESKSRIVWVLICHSKVAPVSCDVSLKLSMNPSGHVPQNGHNSSGNCLMRSRVAWQLALILLKFATFPRPALVSPIQNEF